jgi:hypothetical protein
MDYFDWIAQEQELTDAALTVRAQVIPPNDNGRLYWDVFYNTRDVPSVELQQISGAADYRPVGERREWNARGRQFNVQTPSLSSLEMIPIESYFKIEEREMQRLLEQTQDNQTLFRSLIKVSIPQRVDELVNMNFRRMEMDGMQAWAKGTITVMNPHLGGTQTVSYGFDASRYQTAGTAWNAVANAYDAFISWFQDGQDATGGLRGVVLRRATFNEIQKDAPVGLNGLTLTRQQLADRISQDLGIEFQFLILEQRLDKFSDGGLTVTRTNVWPAGYVAGIPTGTTIGDMARAPVGRAFRLARMNPDAQIDVRGMSVFKEIGGNGRELTHECQINAFPLPIEANMWSINAGV